MDKTYFETFVDQGLINQFSTVWEGKWCYLEVEANLQVQKFGGRHVCYRIRSDRVPGSVVRCHSVYEDPAAGTFLQLVREYQDRSLREAGLWRPVSDDLLEAQTFAEELAEITGSPYIVYLWGETGGQFRALPASSLICEEEWIVYRTGEEQP